MDHLEVQCRQDKQSCILQDCDGTAFHAVFHPFHEASPKGDAFAYRHLQCWFIGDDNYLAISFYTGGDSSNKTPNITFHVYLSDFYLSPMGKSKSAIPLCCIQLSNTPGSVGWETKEPVINEIRNKLIGFECNRFTDGIESRWNRFYEHLDNNGIDYLACLEEFLTKDKPVIDEIIRNAKNPEIGFLDTYKVDRKISVIERISRL